MARITVTESPNVPRPDGLIRELADMLARIERNYEIEGSGPGSRFEGRLLEDVQAGAVVRRFVDPPDRAEAALDDDPDEALAVIEGRHKGSQAWAALCLAEAIRCGNYPEGWIRL